MEQSLDVFKAPPERVYKAILDPAANCKWLPPHGFTGKVHQIDARVGGAFRVVELVTRNEDTDAPPQLAVNTYSLPVFVPIPIPTGSVWQCGARRAK